MENDVFKGWEDDDDVPEDNVNDELAVGLGVIFWYGYFAHLKTSRILISLPMYVGSPYLDIDVWSTENSSILSYTAVPSTIQTEAFTRWVKSAVSI
jgi:hypothetical protein